MHPSQELNESTNWNMECIYFAVAVEVLTIIVWTDWAVVGVVVGTGFIPLIMNIVWLLLPFRHKRRAVINNSAALAFYVIQTLFFCFYVGVATYFIASTYSYDWRTAYLWSNMWLMSSCLLTLAGLLAALHSYSFTMLVFKYRRHLRRC